MLSCFFTSNYYGNDDYVEYNNVYLDKTIDDADVCLICWEKEKGQEVLSKMSDIIIKSCACNSVMHVSCFHNWKIKTKSCPICRELFNKNDKNEDECEEYVGISIYMAAFAEKAKETSKNIIRFVALVCVATLITNITFHIIMLKQLNNFQQ
jgi:hypothetical protein